MRCIFCQNNFNCGRVPPGGIFACPHCKNQMRFDRRGVANPVTRNVVRPIRNTPTIKNTNTNINTNTITNTNNEPILSSSNNINLTIDETGNSQYFHLPATYSVGQQHKFTKDQTRFIGTQYKNAKDQEMAEIKSKMEATLQQMGNPKSIVEPIKETKLNTNFDADYLLKQREAEIAELTKGVKKVDPSSFQIRDNNNNRMHQTSDNYIKLLEQQRIQELNQFQQIQGRGTDANKMGLSGGSLQPDYYRMN